MHLHNISHNQKRFRNFLIVGIVLVFVIIIFIFSVYFFISHQYLSTDSDTNVPTNVEKDNTLKGIVKDFSLGEGGKIGGGILIIDVDTEGGSKNELVIFLADTLSFVGLEEADIANGVLLSFPDAYKIDERHYSTETIKKP